jgi:hypothetical protein
LSDLGIAVAMTRPLAICAFAACLLVACNVATVKEVPSAIAQNQCKSDADCAGGECANSQCLSHSGTLQTVLLETTPPADATSIAGVQFLNLFQGLSPAGGDLPLPLQLVSQVTGEVTLADPKCTPSFVDNGMTLASSADSSIPALVSLTPSVEVAGGARGLDALGLFSPPAVAQTTLINDSYFGFALNVPPGTYDIYVAPLHQADDTCVVPPQLLRAQPIDGGLSIRLPNPSSFEFHVTWPLGDGALDGWVVDMLDPVSGRVISNSAGLAVGAGSKTDYAATLYYLPVVGDTSDMKAQELVRLSPPDGVTAPTVLLARSALGMFDANSGTLDQFTALPTPVHVQGQVTALATPNPVAATVTLVATKISGIEPGVLASFVRTVTVGNDGQFELDLLPGTYMVSAVPGVELDATVPSSADSKLAEVTEQWIVADSPSTQAGKVIELGQALPINGQAFDASGSTPVVTALVQAVASSGSITTDVLSTALGEATLVPRAATGSVLSTGDFTLIADPGTFDISVRPLATTGFSWLVVPSIAVGTTPETSAGVNLGSLTLPLPVAYGGTVTVPGAMADSLQPVPGALIRAYVYTSAGAYVSDPTMADSVVQIAETRADSSGQFTLLIPASLNGGMR